jgi:hypothetical protein
MADPAKVVAKVRSHGANIMLDGQKLVIINREKLPAKAFDFIRQHAKKLADFLSSEGDFEERAAIIEFGAGVSRPVAEGLAIILLASPPKDCNPADWTWFVGKAAAIIDEYRRPA